MGMSGKYHRTYLRERVQAAFEKMQEATGTASNAYILKAVEDRLAADGFYRKSGLFIPELKPVKAQPAATIEQKGSIEEEGPRPARRRRRRSQ